MDYCISTYPASAPVRDGLPFAATPCYSHATVRYGCSAIFVFLGVVSFLCLQLRATTGEGLPCPTAHPHAHEAGNKHSHRHAASCAHSDGVWGDRQARGRLNPTLYNAHHCCESHHSHPVVRTVMIRGRIDERERGVFPAGCTTNTPLGPDLACSPFSTFRAPSRYRLPEHLLCLRTVRLLT